MGFGKQARVTPVGERSLTSAAWRLISRGGPCAENFATWGTPRAAPALLRRPCRSALLPPRSLGPPLASQAREQLAPAPRPGVFVVLTAPSLSSPYPPHLASLPSYLGRTGSF